MKLKDENFAEARTYNQMTDTLANNLALQIKAAEAAVQEYVHDEMTDAAVAKVRDFEQNKDANIDGWAETQLIAALEKMVHNLKQREQAALLNRKMPEPERSL